MKRIIKDRDGVRDYLIRYYLLFKNQFNYPFNVFLHKILLSDNDAHLHNHPWVYATLILKGGYHEETPDGTFWRAPGHFRLKLFNDYHRLILPKDASGNEIPCWTLFFVGKKHRTESKWYFMVDGTPVESTIYLENRLTGNFFDVTI